MVAEAAEGIFKGVVKPILDKWIPDAKDRLDAEQAIMKALLATDLAQIEVNKVEAANENIFVSGWRPFIGWVCGSAYAYTFVLQPFLIFLATLFQIPMKTDQLPHLNWSELGFVLAGMLGLSTLRSIEKTKGK
jgi:hypothetical protein